LVVIEDTLGMLVVDMREFQSVDPVSAFFEFDLLLVPEDLMYLLKIRVFDAKVLHAVDLGGYLLR
jgi:hypothetical protein